MKQGGESEWAGERVRVCERVRMRAREREKDLEEIDHREGVCDRGEFVNDCVCVCACVRLHVCMCVT